MNKYGLEKLRSSRRHFGVIAMSSSIQPSDSLHNELRDVLSDLRSAMDWLEDTPEFDAAHEALDQAGRFAREVYPDGCLLAYHDESYWAECPVALAHNRIGISSGILVYASECSICGLDPEDCSHITGRIYDGQQCFHVITDGEISETSYVSRPNQPDCRITSVSISSEDLKEKLGDEFEPGIPVSCDRCLSPCTGVNRGFEEAFPT